MTIGIELAGLIMAAIPIIIKGLKHYADGVRTIQKWWRYKMELESLATTLIVEQTLFAESCKKLLNDLAIDDDLFVELIENPGGPLWRDQQLDRKLKQHLGSKYSLYQALIEDMNSAVKELLRRLEIDDQGKTLFGNYNEFKTQWKRVKFSIFRRGYDEALRKIRENNTLLERLLNQDKDLLPERKRKMKSGTQFNEVRRHAANLYRGLARSWTCDCNAAHCTTLRLDARIPGLCKIDQGPLTKACEEALVTFKVIFLFETEADKANLPWIQQEADIRVVKYEETIEQPQVAAQSGDVDANSTGRKSPGPLLSVKNSSGKPTKLKKAMKKSSISTSEGKKVRFAETPLEAVCTMPLDLHKGNPPTQIENLCLAMQETSVTVTCAESCLGYLDQADRHRLELYLSQQNQMAHHESIKSLADLLLEQNREIASPILACGNLPLARGERLGLALTVASSVLQLYDTPWLHQYWSKRDILVDMTPKDKILERAFLSESFPPPTISDIPGYNLAYPFRNLTLFCLGVVLIEITLGRTLESMRNEDDPLNMKGEPDMLTYLNIARRVLDMGTVSTEAGFRYGEVVYRCIWCDFGVLNTSLDCADFRRAVYDGVIAPLEEDLKNFYGFLG